MIKVFPIDFIRQALEQTLLKQHIRNANFFGGKNQVNILSFYEQLKSQDEVDRFVETYRDLTEQQNRTGLIMNGVLVSSENPSITNLYSTLIVPMTFTCSFRVKLSNRDQAVETINNLIEELKGRKVDIAELKCASEEFGTSYVPFVVGTIGHNEGKPILKNGDYVGTINNVSDKDQVLNDLSSKGAFDVDDTEKEYLLYCTSGEQLKVVRIYFYGSQTTWGCQIIEDDGTYDDIIFPPKHESFEKYKLSLSFDAVRCDEPRNLNGDEYCELSFGGSATLVNNGVKLGNDLVKISVSKKLIKADSDISFDDNITFLEPLEMPSGSNANTNPIQLVSNKFLSNSHTDSLALTLQYTFIVDENIPLLNQWFEYARYGVSTTTTISPNIIYEVVEYWSNWGRYEPKKVKTKIVENIDIENTESDTLTLSVSMQIQGENN